LCILVSDLERIDYKDQLEILEWISPIQYTAHHKTVEEARTDGTGEWLLRHEKFREGAGKTFLTSRVIDHLLEISTLEGFAFFYCNQIEEDRRKPLSVLQSYVRQLSTTIRNPRNIRKRLRDL
jgi:ankyrin repeat domain-containing protein 50